MKIVFEVFKSKSNEILVQNSKLFFLHESFYEVNFIFTEITVKLLR